MSHLIGSDWSLAHTSSLQDVTFNGPAAIRFYWAVQITRPGLKRLNSRWSLWLGAKILVWTWWWSSWAQQIWFCQLIVGASRQPWMFHTWVICPEMAQNDHPLSGIAALSDLIWRWWYRVGRMPCFWVLDLVYLLLHATLKDAANVSRYQFVKFLAHGFLTMIYTWSLALQASAQPFIVSAATESKSV